MMRKRLLFFFFLFICFKVIFQDENKNTIPNFFTILIEGSAIFLKFVNKTKLSMIISVQQVGNFAKFYINYRRKKFCEEMDFSIHREQ